MDALAIIRDAANAALAWFRRATSTWNEAQWLCFGLGLLLTAVSAYGALKAERPGRYRLATFGVKAGFALVALAFAYPYARDLYDEAVGLFGNPLAALAVLGLGSVLGYNLTKMLLSRRGRGD